MEFACGVAKGLGANITLLHVLHLPTKEYGDAVYATVVDRKSSVLRSCDAALQAEAAAAKETGIETGTLLREGNPAREIVNVARTEKFDLVVIATHSRRRLARGLLGSVAEKVVRLSPIPVLTLRGVDESNEGQR